MVPSNLILLLYCLMWMVPVTLLWVLFLLLRGPCGHMWAYTSIGEMVPAVSWDRFRGFWKKALNNMESCNDTFCPLSSSFSNLLSRSRKKSLFTTSFLLTSPWSVIIFLFNKITRSSFRTLSKAAECRQNLVMFLLYSFLGSLFIFGK